MGTVNPCGTQVIGTERLVLRTFECSDSDAVLRNWAGDAKVQNMYGEPVYETLEDVNGLLGKYIQSYESGTYFRWGIFEKSSGECIGQIAYFLVDVNNHFGEIEYCIGRAFQGKGYATEACRAVIRYGFEQIGFNKVQICCRPSNTPSNKVIDKCGFTYEGTLRDFFYMDGHYEDRKYYSILASEYKGL